MRKLLFVFAVFVFAVELSAQEAGSLAPQKIGAADATNYYGKEMIVTGKVAQVTIRPTANFLNLDKKFPDSPFSVVIFPKQRELFGDLNALRGKSIEVKGKIKNYNDKPEIILDSTNQLTVLGVTNLSLFLNPVTPATGTPATSSPPNSPSINSFPEIM